MNQLCPDVLPLRLFPDYSKFPRLISGKPVQSEPPNGEAPKATFVKGLKIKNERRLLFRRNLRLRSGSVEI